ncbi:unnamed protein product, partial [Parnassius apollo]
VAEADMSVQSSLSSGSGAPQGAANIIDLDRYMRATVRPGQSPRHERRWRESGNVTTNRCRDSARAPGSTASLLAFRAACERALREQQEQIARVAQLCEQLGEKQNDRRSERHAERRGDRRPDRTKQERSKLERPRPKRPNPECSSSSVESTDFSSSSRSARERRKDKHRTDECKTYKIIMNKLDELSRLFAARRPVPPVSLGSKQPTFPAARVASSGSVSVSDKFVATEPDLRACIKSRNLSPTVQILLTPRPTERKVGLQIQTQATGTNPITGEEGAEIRQRDINRTEGKRENEGTGFNRRLAITRANFLEIAPSPRKRPNITTESVVQRGHSSESIRDRISSFDLEDPIRLYAQAKRLQALHTTTRRARSEDRTMLNDRLGVGRLDGRFDERLKGDSLCARCRGYWRAFRHCFASQLFCRPEDACAC